MSWGVKNRPHGVSRLEGLVTLLYTVPSQAPSYWFYNWGPFMERVVQLALVISRAVPQIALSTKATPSSKSWP